MAYEAFGVISQLSPNQGWQRISGFLQLDERGWTPDIFISNIRCKDRAVFGSGVSKDNVFESYPHNNAFTWGIRCKI